MLTPPAKGETTTFLIDKQLKTQDLHHTAAEQGKRDDNKTPPKTPDSLRQGASQAAGAAPTLRYGPAGDNAPPLRLKPAAERRAATSGAILERLLRAFLVVRGGTASGNTTLLNVLIALIPDDQRIVAIEDTLELPIDSPNRVRFEARRLQQGALTIRDLVRHALRHRPDHIVVGEVRGTEAADLLQALNTGHGGSPATPPPR